MQYIQSLPSIVGNQFKKTNIFFVKQIKFNETRTHFTNNSKKMCERMKPSEKEKKKTENQTPAV